MNGSKLIKHITERVEDELDKLYLDKKTCTVAEVQDVLEKMMMVHKLPETAKSMILYRAERDRIRESKSKIMDTIAEITQADVKKSNLLRDNRKYQWRYTSLRHVSLW